ncbi:MAG TPA: cytochrome c biogenesis protein ResB [Blastocatellia bacterium]|jgi:cytochrome c biogenesis protein|nr:cytochrome c biogenesis protein ResB [Blastocatellia bacterium]
MSREETELTPREYSSEKSEAGAGEAKTKQDDSVVDRLLRLMSSVRFGIIMLILVLACCVAGMLIMQQNVQGFSQYYERLSPAQREIYSSLGLFDIYHSSYFTILLAITALNIILSSIDRFPTAWRYVRRPRSTPSRAFIRAQMLNTSREANSTPEKAAQKIVEIWKEFGFRARLEKGHQGITVFAQRNVWNRLGAYVVHVSLLTIFVGGLLTSRYGVGGTMVIRPGETSNSFITIDAGVEGGAGEARMPFGVECTDLQQELVRPEGGLDVMNTIDWLTYVKIREYGAEIPALIHLNSPFDHRGYRFFQSSFEPVGNARQVTLEMDGSGGESREVTIQRNGSANVDGLGLVSYVNFYPDFTIEHGHPTNASDDYNNPAAELRITAADGGVRTTFAHSALSEMRGAAATPGDRTISLKSFEKVATSHTLTVQYDPGRIPVYIGFVLLTLSLSGVFFFSHQRIWAVVEPDGKRSRVHFGGHTNRNKAAFEARFDTLVRASVGGKGKI